MTTDILSMKTSELQGHMQKTCTKVRCVNKPKTESLFLESITWAGCIGNSRPAGHVHFRVYRLGHARGTSYTLPEKTMKPQGALQRRASLKQELCGFPGQLAGRKEYMGRQGTKRV